MGDPSGVARVDSDRGEDRVVREEPLLIEVGEETVLTMRTPGHDADLALGFLLSEGILAASGDAARVEVVPRGDPASARPVDAARVVLADGAALGPVAREKLSRAHAVRVSCGLCRGSTSPS